MTDLPKQKPTPPLSPLHRVQSPLNNNHNRLSLSRGFVSFRPRTSTRLSLLAVIVILAVFAINELRCEKYGCITRTGFMEGVGAKEKEGFVGGGAVLPDVWSGGGPSSISGAGTGDKKGMENSKVKEGGADSKKEQGDWAKDGEMVVMNKVSSARVPSPTPVGKWVDKDHDEKLKTGLHKPFYETGLEPSGPAPTAAAAATAAMVVAAASASSATPAASPSGALILYGSNLPPTPTASASPTLSAKPPTKSLLAEGARQRLPPAYEIDTELKPSVNPPPQPPAREIPMRINAHSPASSLLFASAASAGAGAVATGEPKATVAVGGSEKSSTDFSVIPAFGPTSPKFGAMDMSEGRWSTP